MTVTEKDEKVFVELCRKLRSVILNYYEGSYSTTRKNDSSPLTDADISSNEVILETLNNRYPSLPVLSEEGKDIPYAERKEWEFFWVVDPLDGTKEFINKEDEFTVNIALIHRNKPVFGLVYVPVYDVIYIGYKDRGSFKITRNDRLKIKASAPQLERGFRVAVSRFHLDDITKTFLKDFESLCTPVVRGSALKFCSVAEGDVDFYLRFGPTWEWDTAAGQAVVEAAGGTVIDLKGEPLKYNKTSIKNGPLFVAPDITWFKNSVFWEWIQTKAIKML